MRATEDIWSAYTQIAIDQGLISESAEEKTNPRYNTHTLSDIEILYGVQPNGKDDDILDKAHPKSVIIAPAYDRVNGLVENLKEQHNIMCGIALKPNNGLLTQHRYVEASQALLDEVVKTAFLLDKNEEYELMALADSCAERLVKESGLGTELPADIGAGTALLGGIGGAALIGGTTGVALALPIAAAVVGVASLVHWIAQSSTEGLKKDTQRTLNQIADLAPKEKETLSPFTDVLNKLLEATDNFVGINNEMTNMLLNISAASTTEEKKIAVANNAVNFISAGKDKQVLEINKRVGELANAVVNSAPHMIEFLKKLDDEDKPDTFVSKFYREHVMNTERVDVIKEIQILEKTCAGISTYINDASDKLAKLREAASNVGSISSVKPGESKPEEKKPEEKKQSRLPSWA